MRLLPLLLLAGCAATTSVQPVADNGNELTAAKSYDGEAYTTCTACHLADGVGVPAAFPPIRNRSGEIASLDGGREYLIGVVSFGLMGTIEVGGTQYFGIMPGNKGMMNEEAIASALNYLVFELTDTPRLDNEFAAFTAEEVLRVHSSTSSASPATAQAQREQLIQQHGDRWPH